MKEDKKGRNKGVVLTLGIAAAMIAVCTVASNAILAYAAKAEEGVGHTAPISQTLTTSDVDLSAQENLNIIVYNNGLVPPADGVSAQYASAVTSEIAERVYGAQTTGRIFVLLCEPYGKNEGLYWAVQAEVGTDFISCAVNAVSGIDRNAYYSANFSGDWNWFDTWDEETAEQERIETEQAAQEISERDAAWLAENPQPTEEENQTALQIKRQSMMDFAASVADKPHGAKAVELVNSLGIGDGAQGVSGAIMMEGSYNDHVSYSVEVLLDNGKYLILKMVRETMELLAYERHDTTLANYLYG